jgi:NhaP-type Na+/H+ or K+/H+ antiporter
MNNTYVCTGVDGLRSVHILDIVLFDILMVLLCGIVLGQFLYFYGVAKLYRTDKKRRICIFVTVLSLYFVGIFTHYIAGVDTMFNYYLGICDKPVRHSECKLY